MTVLALLTVVGVTGPTGASAADSSFASSSLTFEARVQAERAIQDVYWSHRIWPAENPSPKPSLEEVVSDEALRGIVEDYLRKSSALERIRARPISHGDLQAEVDRMARGTQSPIVLRELFGALGDDPFLIAETLARKSLADRLLRNLYAGDDALHAEPNDHVPFERWWQAERTRFDTQPAAPLQGYVLPEPGIAAESIGAEASALVPAPSGRIDHSAVWTGAEMIVWGGIGDLTTTAVPLDTGGRYDPATDTWTATALAGAPAARLEHTAIWTGTEMIVWGGSADRTLTSRLDSGSRYDPVTDTWIDTSTTAAPAGRLGHSAVWTGAEMIIWAGAAAGTNGRMNTGGRYDPSTDTWTPTSLVNAPLETVNHLAFWTGSEMLVWGGIIAGFDERPGFYDPASDTWTRGSDVGTPPGHANHIGAWNGSEMIVWGGQSGQTQLQSGARYDPASDQWTSMTTLGAPSARNRATAIAVGSRMIVWGGAGGSGPGGVGTGGIYDPASDTWLPTSTNGAPASRASHTAVWTGTDMIVWGGSREVGANPPIPGSGGRYNPATDTWKKTASDFPPVCTVTLTPSVLWPPDGRMERIEAFVKTTPSGSGVSVVLEKIRSNEADDGTAGGDGSTEDDIQDARIGVADFLFKVRAERSGSGRGRVYTAVYRVTSSGGSTTCGASVVVPHDANSFPVPLPGLGGTVSPSEVPPGE